MGQPLREEDLEHFMNYRMEQTDIDCMRKAHAIIIGTMIGSIVGTIVFAWFF